jgi:uncharacterized membrane protein
VFLLAALLAGLSAGLRSMMPLAIVAWASRDWSALHQSWLSFVAAPAATYIFATFAVLELIGDKLPFTPSRLKPGPLSARILSGGLCGAVLATAAQHGIVPGALVGAIGGAIGSFAGFAMRRSLTAWSRQPFLAAVVEDLLAMGLAAVAVSRI